MDYKFKLETVLNYLSIQEETAKILLNTFCNIAGKTYYIDGYNGSMVALKNENLQAIQILAEKATGIVFDKKEAGFIKDTLCTLNGYSYLEKSRDIAGARLIIEMLEHADVVKIIHAGFPIVKIPEPISFTGYREFIKEYTLLFPLFSQVISAVVQAKIAPTKESFLYIVAPSNFGKSFFLAAMVQAGLGVEIRDIEAFSKNSGASSVRVNSLVDASCLMVDEFEYFNKELKNLTFSVTIAEKFQMAQTVPVGLKLMFSASLSGSFVGGVDEQLMNRVSMMKIENGGKKIGELPTFKKFGKDACRDFLAFYIREFAQTRVREIQSDENPLRFCSEELRKKHKKFGIAQDGNIESLADSLYNTIADAIKDMHFKDDDLIHIDKDNTVFIRKPVKTIIRLLETQLDAGKAKHYKGYINNFITESKMVENHMKNPKFLNGKTVKGIMFSMPYEVVYE